MGIEIKDLTFEYNESRTALRNVSLSIPAGEKTAIVGLNGSGKSTLLHHINGMKLPTKGHVYVDGIEVCEKNLKEIRRIVGYVFDYPDHQLFSTSVEQDIRFGMDNYNYSEEKKLELLDEITGVLDIKDLLELPPFHLSLGQKKRVALAGIMVLEPDYLILDEPFSGLDNETDKFFRKFLDKQVENGTTIFYSNHDTNNVYEWADNVIVIEKGEILTSGKVSDVMTQEKLYERVGLEKPYLFELFQYLDEKPRTMEEAKKILEEFRK